MHVQPLSYGFDFGPIPSETRAQDTEEHKAPTKTEISTSGGLFRPLSHANESRAIRASLTVLAMIPPV